MRFWLILLLAGCINPGTAAEKSLPGDAEGWARVGLSSFEHCEFKTAAHAFTKAIQFVPKDARLHHWLGRSYAKMAEIASPLHASRDARKARASLERAVELEPRNHEYLRELFAFYLDSPEWMTGGLDKAATLVDRVEPDDPGAQAFLRELVVEARQEYRGLGWRLRQTTLVPSEQIGHAIP